MDDSIDYAINIANKLRNNDVMCEIYFNKGKMKKKFSYADKLKIPYVIIIGSDEVKNNMVTVKNIQNGEQNSMSIEEAVNVIKNS